MEYLCDYCRKWEQCHYYNYKKKIIKDKLNEVPRCHFFLPKNIYLITKIDIPTDTLENIERCREYQKNFNGGKCFKCVHYLGNVSLLYEGCSYFRDENLDDTKMYCTIDCCKNCDKFQTRYVPILEYYATDGNNTSFEYIGDDYHPPFASWLEKNLGTTNYQTRIIGYSNGVEKIYMSEEDFEKLRRRWE